MTAPLVTPVPSPCINICEMHPATGWCAGCLRTLEEIGGWSRLDDAQKSEVLQRLNLRRTAWQQMQAAGQAPSVLVPRRTAR